MSEEQENDLSSADVEEVPIQEEILEVSSGTYSKTDKVKSTSQKQEIGQYPDDLQSEPDQKRSNGNTETSVSNRDIESVSRPESIEEKKKRVESLLQLHYTKATEASAKSEENNDSLRSVKNDTQIVDQGQQATLIAKKHPINPVSGSSLLAEIKADRQVTKNAITVANGKKFIIKYQQGSHQSVTYIYHCQSRCYFRLPRRIQNWEKSQHIYGNIQSIEKIRAE